MENNKFNCLKEYIQLFYEDIFKCVYIGNYNKLDILYKEVKNKMLEIENNDNLIFTINYILLKNTLIKIFELKNPMTNLDILNIFLNN